MFNSIINWIQQPGMWNDGVVACAAVVIVGMIALVAMTRGEQ